VSKNPKKVLLLWNGLEFIEFGGRTHIIYGYEDESLQTLWEDASDEARGLGCIFGVQVS